MTQLERYIGRGFTNVDWKMNFVTLFMSRQIIFQDYRSWSYGNCDENNNFNAPEQHFGMLDHLQLWSSLV
jgi:hypothetical protein